VAVAASRRGEIEKNVTPGRPRWPLRWPHAGDDHARHFR